MATNTPESPEIEQIDTVDGVPGQSGGVDRASRWPMGIPWQVPATGIISMIGLGISIYLTLVHYDTSVPLSCPAHGEIDCAAVITSPQSVIFGLPVAVYGVIWHFGMFILFTPWAWRMSAGLGRISAKAARRVGFMRLISIFIAIGFVIYLIDVELFQVQKICLWCTSVHITTFTLLICVVSSLSWSLGQGFVEGIDPDQG